MSLYSYTTNFKFGLINYASPTWHEDEYNNWNVVDSILQASLDNGVPFVVATGAVNTYVATYSPAVVLSLGVQLAFKTNAANTGAVTLNVNGAGAKAILKDGVALVSGELASGAYVRVIYDGTQFLLIEPRSITIGDGTIAATKLTVGHPNWDGSGNITTTGNGNITASGTGKVIGSDVLIGAKPAFRYNGAFTSAVWYEGAGAPAGGLGNDGDFYIRTS